MDERDFLSTAKHSLARLYRRCLGFAKGKKIELDPLPGLGVHVFYGWDRLPSMQEVVKGGIVKFQRLNEVFPNTPRGFNILYMVSSGYAPFAEQIKRSALRKGAKFVWNQNGVAYPAWMPSGWEAANARMAGFLHDADYVFFQSEFAKSCSERFLGKTKGPSEILYNAVDTGLFCPAEGKRAPNGPTLLVVGSQYHNYPLESAVRSLAVLKKTRADTRLLVAGKVFDHVMEHIRKPIAELNLEDSIRFLPPFTQEGAVEIFRRADILFHTKIQDVCPGVVVEAMACGLPVVYSKSGGVPELVGAEAGVGVQSEATWEERIPPAPEAWAEAVLRVADKQPQYSQAARQRAVEHFDIQPWIERHRQAFTSLLKGKPQEQTNRATERVSGQSL